MSTSESKSIESFSDNKLIQPEAVAKYAFSVLVATAKAPALFEAFGNAPVLVKSAFTIEPEPLKLNLPVPWIVNPEVSRFPPRLGAVSVTTLVVIEPGLNALAPTFHTNACPLVGACVVVSTSLKASIDEVEDNISFQAPLAA